MDRSRLRRYGLRAALVVGGALAGVLVAEGILRIHNPLMFSVRGNTIALPANIELQITNRHLPGVDPVIHYSRNSLGFRGPEPPSDLGAVLSIVVVGGSTTECLYLSDDHTWPHRLGEALGQAFDPVWVNNAGLDGHSSRGHLLLTRDYLLQLSPKIVLIMAGINDQHFPQGTRMDTWMSQDGGGGNYARNTLAGWKPAPPSTLAQAAEYSEILTIALNLSRYCDAQRAGITHRPVNLKGLGLRDADPGAETARRRKLEGNLAPFEQRMTAMVRTLQGAGIEPILVTQSMLWGAGVDDVTGVDLARVRRGRVNGRVIWEGLEMFNDVTRKIGAAEGVFVVELGRGMPRSSRFYYDGMHYTNAGAEQAAEIIYGELCPHLHQRYPSLASAPCRARSQ